MARDVEIEIKEGVPKGKFLLPFSSASPLRPQNSDLCPLISDLWPILCKFALKHKNLYRIGPRSEVGGRRAEGREGESQGKFFPGWKAEGGGGPKGKFLLPFWNVRRGCHPKKSRKDKRRKSALVADGSKTAAFKN